MDDDKVLRWSARLDLCHIHLGTPSLHCGLCGLALLDAMLAAGL